MPNQSDPFGNYLNHRLHYCWFSTLIHSTSDVGPHQCNPFFGNYLNYWLHYCRFSTLIHTTSDARPSQRDPFWKLLKLLTTLLLIPHFNSYYLWREAHPTRSLFRNYLNYWLHYRWFLTLIHTTSDARPHQCNPFWKLLKLLTTLLLVLPFNSYYLWREARPTRSFFGNYLNYWLHYCWFPTLIHTTSDTRPHQRDPFWQLLKLLATLLLILHFNSYYLWREAAPMRSFFGNYLNYWLHYC